MADSGSEEDKSTIAINIVLSDSVDPRGEKLPAIDVNLYLTEISFLPWPVPSGHMSSI